MKLGSICYSCIIGREVETVEQFSDEQAKAMYLQEVTQIMADAGKNGTSSPEAMIAIRARYEHYFHMGDEFAEIKKKYNGWMLEKEEAISAQVQKSEDPLKRAMQMAMLGNYIDFATMIEVNNETLDQLLQEAESVPVEEGEYAHLKEDLQKAKKLVYLLDNCGEIVMDKILIRQLKKTYPHLSILAMTRGSAIANDVTMDDAKEIGLDQICQVMGSGVPAPGTPLHLLSPEAKAAIAGADLIIAKGQGNFESFYGEGKNAYYMFLCKCPWFQKQFQTKMLRGVFANEHRITLANPVR